MLGYPLVSGVSVFRDTVAKQQVLGLTSMPPVRQMSLRVDEIFCRAARRRQEKFVACVEGVTYSDLPSILLPLRTVVRQKASSSRAHVFRVKFVDRL